MLWPVIFLQNCFYGSKKWPNQFNAGDHHFLDPALAEQFERDGIVQIMDKPEQEKPQLIKIKKIKKKN